MESAHASGKYIVRCFGPDGDLKWEDEIVNLVTTEGKNVALDTYLAGSAYTATGPFMGLISSTSYTGVNIADTMSSHSGWLEAGATDTPHYSGNRPTVAFNAASAGSKASSSPASFTFTGSGTVKGCFLAFDTGATHTVDDTGGKLYSAGLLSGGDKVVSSGFTLAVTYTASL